MHIIQKRKKWDLAYTCLRIYNFISSKWLVSFWWCRRHEIYLYGEWEWKRKTVRMEMVFAIYFAQFCNNRVIQSLIHVLRYKKNHNISSGHWLLVVPLLLYCYCRNKNDFVLSASSISYEVQYLAGGKLFILNSKWADALVGSSFSAFHLFSRNLRSWCGLNATKWNISSKYCSNAETLRHLKKNVSWGFRWRMERKVINIWSNLDRKQKIIQFLF